jgi:hypothetical protein
VAAAAADGGGVAGHEQRQRRGADLAGDARERTLAATAGARPVAQQRALGGGERQQAERGAGLDQVEELGLGQNGPSRPRRALRRCPGRSASAAVGDEA